MSETSVLYNKMSNRKELRLNNIIIYLFCIFALTPFLYRNASRYIMVAILGLTLLSQLRIVLLNKRYPYIRKTIFCIYLWLGYQFFLRIIGYSTSAIGNYMTSLFFYCTIIQMFYIMIYYDDKQKRHLGIFIIIVLLVNTIDNLRLGSIFPNCNSYMYRSWGSQYLQMNVGGTEFAAAIMFLCGCLLISMLWYRKRIKRASRIAILAALAVMIVYLFWMSGRATSIIVLITMVGFALFLGKKKVLIPLVIVAIICILLSDADLLLLINNSRITERLADLSGFLHGEEINTDGSLFRRVNSMRSSVSTFFASPLNVLFGIGNHDTGIGHHSEIIDTLPKYGIIGFISLCIIFFRVCRVICSFNKENKKLSLLGFAFFIVYSFFNISIDPMIGIVVFMLVPNIGSVFKTENQVRNKTMTQRNYVATTNQNTT